MSKRDVSIKCVYASPERMMKKDITDKKEEIYPFLHASDGLSEENMMEEVYGGPDFDPEPIDDEEDPEKVSIDLGETLQICRYCGRGFSMKYAFCPYCGKSTREIQRKESPMMCVYASPEIASRAMQMKESPMACVYAAPQKKKNKLFSEIFKRKK